MFLYSPRGGSLLLACCTYSNLGGSFSFSFSPSLTWGYDFSRVYVILLFLLFLLLGCNWGGATKTPFFSSSRIVVVMWLRWFDSCVLDGGLEFSTDGHTDIQTDI